MIRPVEVDPSTARGAARSILRGREFRPEQPPKPLESPLRWLGDRLNGVADWIGNAFSSFFQWLFDLLPGIWGTIVGVIILVAIVAGVVWLLSRTPRGRRALHRDDAEPAPREDPDQLEAAADAAARAGDYARAIRFRYRAGLIRLDEAAVINLRPWNTSATLARRIASPRFDRIAETFDAVTYGGEPASDDTDASARADWPALLAEVKHR